MKKARASDRARMSVVRVPRLFVDGFHPVGSWSRMSDSTMDVGSAVDVGSPTEEVLDGLQCCGVS